MPLAKHKHSTVSTGDFKIRTFTKWFWIIEVSITLSIYVQLYKLGVKLKLSFQLKTSRTCFFFFFQNGKLSCSYCSLGHEIILHSYCSLGHNNNNNKKKCLRANGPCKYGLSGLFKKNLFFCFWWQKWA